jgi:DnaJ family protein C protein 19
MQLLGLGLGILLVITLHAALSWMVRSRPEQVKRMLQWLAIIGIVIIILLLVRFGAPLVAAAVGGLVGLAALLSRLTVLMPLFSLWNSHRDRAPTPVQHPASMTKDEAARILNIRPNASKDEILSAHKHLIQRVHPDHGGSDYLASQINQAKDVLLKSIIRKGETL